METIKELKIKFSSLSPVLFCKHINAEKLEGETPQQQEERTWKQRAHYDSLGKVMIPGFMLQSSLEPAAKLLGKRVNNAKMGKALTHYIRLIQITGDICTPITESTLEGKIAFVSANGQVGGSKVPRTYPIIPKWEGVLIVSYPTIGNVLNDDLVMEHLQVAGNFIGVGHWRPGAPSCGNFGRFSVNLEK